MSSTSPTAMAVAMAQVDPALIAAFIERGVGEAMAVALAQAGAILEHGVDRAGAPLSRILRSIGGDNIRWLDNAPFDLPRPEGHREAGVHTTKGLQLEGLDVLEAYAVSSRIRITSRSIARYRLANAILSHPVDGPRPRIRQPSARFQKKIRPRTPQELAALARANAKRAEDKKRREAKAAVRV